MTVTADLLVFLHLKANCSPKIVEKFCKEANFSPPEKSNETKISENEVTISKVMQWYNEQNKSNDKKRKAQESESEDSSSDSDSESEDEAPKAAPEKKAKLDLTNTECYKCHQLGHMSRECPQTNKEKKSYNDYEDDSDTTCYNCNKTGHFSKECPDKSTCYSCNKPGHLSKDCPDKFADVFCYNCGKNGHLSRNCPDKAGGLKCYNCSQSGHLSKDCTEKNGANSQMLCYNCQTVGHMARDCQNPRVPRPGSQENRSNGSGGGRGGGNNRSNWKRPSSFGTGANSMPLGSKTNNTE